MQGSFNFFSFAREVIWADEQGRAGQGRAGIEAYVYMLPVLGLYEVHMYVEYGGGR